MIPDDFKNHAFDAAKVIGVNTTAFAISMADIQAILNIAAPAAAMIYTGLKTWDLIDQMIAKKKEAKRNENCSTSNSDSPYWLHNAEGGQIHVTGDGQHPEGERRAEESEVCK